MKLPYTTLRRGMLAAFVATIGLSSCATHYLAVQPRRPDSEWADGRPALSTNFDSVEVQVCYAHLRDKELMFEVEIRNGSAGEVAVNPGTFYYMPVLQDPKKAKRNAANNQTGVNYVPAQVYAIDPERRIQELANKLAYEARKANGISFMDWMNLASGVTDVLTPPKGTEQQKRDEELRREDERIRNAVLAEQQHTDHAIKADQAVMEKQLWEVKVLRKNILKPGELARGYVTFPVYNQTMLLHLALPIGARTLLFDFDQERKKVEYAPAAPVAPVVASKAPLPPAGEVPIPPAAPAMPK